jgi:hypothetical protein
MMNGVVHQILRKRANGEQRAIATDGLDSSSPKYTSPNTDY